MARIIEGWDWPSFDEFHGYNGDCMEHALEMCLAAVEGREPTIANMNRLVETFNSHDWAGSNGATTINACISYVPNQAHHHLITAYGYQEPHKFDLDLLTVFAGEYAILLNVARGSALHDAWTNQDDEPSLHYHGIAILGIADDGDFLCADGDNHESALGRYEKYSMASIIAAQPCGLLIFAK